jgi:hypothetical protein
MQVEILVWLSAGIGLGLFIAMAVLAIFAASERQLLRRRQRRSIVPVAAALPAAEPEPAPEPPAAAPQAAPLGGRPEPDLMRMGPDRVAAAPEPAVSSPAAPAPAREVGQSPAPVAAADRPQLDIEGLFERAFQTSLGPESEAGNPPERKDV